MNAKSLSAGSLSIVRNYRVEIEGIANYMCGGHFTSEKLPGEDAASYDRRCYLDRAHKTPEGNIAIPARAFKGAICAAATQSSDKVAGKGQQTWSKTIRGGIIIAKPFDTGVKAATAPFLDLFCAADGKRGGSGPKVLRRFPYAPCGYKGIMEIAVLNPALPEDLLLKYIQFAGLQLGVGSFRAANEGDDGRFIVNSFTEVKAK